MPLESKPSLIRLERAYFCLDCECVCDDSKKCLGCGSSSIYSLARFLNHNPVGPAHTCIDQPNYPCLACTQVVSEYQAAWAKLGFNLAEERARVFNERRNLNV